MTPVDFVLLALLLASLCAVVWFAMRYSRVNADARIADDREQAAKAARDDALTRLRGAETALVETNARLQAITAQLAEQHQAGALLQKDVAIARQREEEVRALFNS